MELMDNFIEDNFKGKNEESFYCRLGLQDMSFESEDECISFYNMYASSIGFSIRLDDVKYDSEKNKVSRRIVCWKEGHRHEKNMNKMDRVRPPRPITRTGCVATIRFDLLKDTGRWHVSDFNDDHNHKLVGPDLVPFLKSHRHVDHSTITKLGSLTSVGIPTNKVMQYITKESGGYQNVGFLIKDLYNYLNKEQRLLMDAGDAGSVISYFRMRQSEDPEFFFRFDQSKDGNLKHLFWSDSVSRNDYIAYSDVVIFDSTYRMNKYMMPLTPFVGVNNHRQTVLFGCAVIADETEESYKWVFKCFLEAMYQKAPLSIVTDGDRAMRNAIRQVFSGSVHRLCSWHLKKNLLTHVRKEGFFPEFSKLMRARISPREFDERWRSLLIQFELEENTWLNNLYLDKRMWAESYLRDHFFAGVTSTQRSESVNAKLHSYIHRGSSLMKMVDHYERWLTQVRTSEAHSTCIVEQSSPFLSTTMRDVESQAAARFTHKIFAFVQTEIKNCSTCVLSEMIYISKSLTKYKFKDYNNEGIIHSVDFSTDDDLLQLFCDCYLMKSVGIPCKHMFAVLLSRHIKLLPDSFILKRWTRAARVGISSALLSSSNLFSKNQKRYIEMSNLGNELFYKASFSDEASQNVLKLIREQLANLDSLESIHERPKQIIQSKFNVKDPVPVPSKGRPRLRIKSGYEKKKKRCGLCHILGHTRPTCPLQKKMDTCLESSKPEASIESFPATINHTESALKGDENSNILSAQLL